MRGPLSAGAAAGIAIEHTSAPLSSRSSSVSARGVLLEVLLFASARFLVSASRQPPATKKSRTLATREGGDVFFHHPAVVATAGGALASAGGFSASGGGFSAKVANADGSPHVFTPCALAPASLTKTRACLLYTSPSPRDRG